MRRVEEGGVEGGGVEDGGDGLGASEARTPWKAPPREARRVVGGEIGTAERTRSEGVSACRGAGEQGCRSTEVQRRRGAEVQWRRGAEVQRCRGAEVQRRDLPQRIRLPRERHSQLLEAA